ncbi:MAG: hypothetical protein AAF708_15270 [Deinococcota bacterium]
MDQLYDDNLNEMLESYGLDDFLETRDVMDILEPDLLENNILTDNEGGLSVRLSIEEDEEALLESSGLDVGASIAPADEEDADDSDQDAEDTDDARALADEAFGLEAVTPEDSLPSLGLSRPVAAQVIPLSSDVSPQLGRIARYFDATEFVTASSKLKTSLNLDRPPHEVFLARAAERALTALPQHQTITVANLDDSGFVPLWDVPLGKTFNDLLMAMSTTASSTASSNVDADVYITDLSDLELDEVLLPLPGTHLMLSRLRPDPEQPERVRGTLSLIGRIGVRSGALFLKLMKEHLESPITLMV